MVILRGKQEHCMLTLASLNVFVPGSYDSVGVVEHAHVHCLVEL